MIEPFVNLDVKVLLQKGISPNEYVFCYLLNKQMFSEASFFLKEFYTDIELDFLKNLEEKRYVKLGFEDSIEVHKIYPRAPILTVLNNIVIKETGYFDEFKAKYPKVTPNGRRLHVNLTKAKTKYDKIVKDNEELHKKILKALELEKAERTLSNSLDYMQNIATYVNNENWNVYFDDIDNGRTSTETDSTKWTKIL